MDENIDLNCQNLNLNLISLDKFEQLPQKKNDENDENEIRHLKKKKKKPQGKKLPLSLDNISSELSSSNANADAKVSLSDQIDEVIAIVTTATTTTTTITIKKKGETTNLPPSLSKKQSPLNIQPPFQFRPPKIQVQLNRQPPLPFCPPKKQAQLNMLQNLPLYLPKVQPPLNMQPLPSFYHRSQSQLNIRAPPPPSFYPPLIPYPPPPVSYPRMTTPMIYQKPPPVYYQQKELIQLKKDKVPLPIIDPESHKPIELPPKTQKQQKVDPIRLFIPNQIYMIPTNMRIEGKILPIKFPTTDLWFNHLNSLSSPRLHENNYCIAIDCEMVGVGKRGKCSSLARVSIVNYYGEVILNRFVKPTREITDYRTKFSGIRPESLTNAFEFKQVQKEVENIMKGHIVVGQSIYFDFKALKTKHPEYLVRDTANYNVIFGLDSGKSSTPSLKKLAKDVLGIDIQEGEHDSIEDAKASMILYRHRQAEWENYLKVNGFPNNNRLSNGMKYSNKNNIRDDEYNRDPNTSKYYSYKAY